MRRYTLVIIPDDAKATKQVTVPRFIFKIGALASFLLATGFGFLFVDYWELRQIRHSYDQISSENAGLKGEARRLMASLESVKQGLNRVKDYSEKLGEITSLKVQQVSKKTGIGPLSREEYKVAMRNAGSGGTLSTTDYLPMGVNPDSLVFRPVFDRLMTLEVEANQQAIELQQLLSQVSQQRSLLMSVPSIAPVRGWITSGYGRRISPFTGESSLHQGIDLASPVGTPIYAPADGVVIFVGAKEGYGNFIMIAHGYGIISRYGHNAENLVQIGQRIKRGEQIATVGMTGQTTGPHLHYEVVLNGMTANPQKFILDQLPASYSFH